MLTNFVAADMLQCISTQIYLNILRYDSIALSLYIYIYVQIFSDIFRYGSSMTRAECRAQIDVTNKYKSMYVLCVCVCGTEPSSPVKEGGYI